VGAPKTVLVIADVLPESDYRFLTSHLCELRAFVVIFFHAGNCRFSTPQKQKTEFRKQETEVPRNRDVETRQLVSTAQRHKWRRQKPVVQILAQFVAS
jgi:hypothetical protein